MATKVLKEDVNDDEWLERKNLEFIFIFIVFTSLSLLIALLSSSEMFEPISALKFN